MSIVALSTIHLVQEVSQSLALYEKHVEHMATEYPKYLYVTATHHTTPHSESCSPGNHMLLQQLPKPQPCHALAQVPRNRRAQVCHNTNTLTGMHMHWRSCVAGKSAKGKETKQIDPVTQTELKSVPRYELLAISYSWPPPTTFFSQQLPERQDYA